MSCYTDKTIPIECSVCPTTDWQNGIGCADGLESMVNHILEFHSDYTLDQAFKYARLWADDAYERVGQEVDDYNKARHEEYRND